MFGASAIKIAVIATIITVIAVGGIVGIIFAVTDVSEEKCTGITPPSNLKLSAENGQVTGVWAASQAPGNCKVTYDIQIFEDEYNVANSTTENLYFSYDSKPCTEVTFVIFALGDETNTPVEDTAQAEIGEITGLTIKDTNVSWELLGKCIYEVTVGEITEKNVEGPTFDLSPFGLQKCVDHTLSVTAYKGELKGDPTQEIFQLEIGDVEDFTIDKYVASGSKIRLSFTKLPECEYFLYYGDDYELKLDDSVCFPISGTDKATCSLSPNEIDDLTLEACMVYNFTIQASSLSGEDGKIGNPTLAELIVTTPGSKIDLDVTYDKTLYTSIATWDDLGPACDYGITYSNDDPVEDRIIYPENGQYEFDNATIVYCKNSDVVLNAYAKNGNEVIATGTKRHRPDLVIPELIVTEEDETKFLYAEWTDLNTGVCAYEVVLDGSPSHEDRIKRNKINFEITARYCHRYAVEVTVFSGQLSGEPTKKEFHKDPERTSVAVKNVRANIVPENKYLVRVDWLVEEEFKECNLQYTVKCAVNDDIYEHTNKVPGPPFDASKCKLDSNAKKFKFGIVPYVLPNNVQVAEYEMECDVSFSTGTMKCSDV